MSPHTPTLKLARYLALVSAITFFANHTPVKAQHASLKPITKTLQDASNNEVPCQLFLPEKLDKAKSYPLVLCLHGGGQMKKAPYKAETGASEKLLQPEMRAKYPAFILVPQTSTGWFVVDRSVQKLVLSGGYRLADHEECGVSKLVLQAVSDVMKDYNVDPARLYVTGQSGGAVYTWELLMRHPGMFAAAVPVCGPGDVTMVGKIDCPVWVFQGSADPIVHVARSHEMVAAMKAAGCTVKYTELPRVGHEAWGPAWEEAELPAWLFAQKRTPQ
jgi:predicted peptidase